VVSSSVVLCDHIGELSEVQRVQINVTSEQSHIGTALNILGDSVSTIAVVRLSNAASSLTFGDAYRFRSTKEALPSPRRLPVVLALKSFGEHNSGSSAPAAD
jgi:hypothetical protein